MEPGPALSVERLTNLTEATLRNTLSQCILMEVLTRAVFVEEHSGQEMDFNLMLAKIINNTFNLILQVQKLSSVPFEQKSQDIT